MFNIRLENFEGPLDLLLYFIKRDKIDIYDIPITEITNEYIQVIDEAKKLDVSVAGEFLFMASMLLRIKTQMLLPRQIDEEGLDIDDPRIDLVAQLIEYKKYRDLAHKLRNLHENNKDSFFRSSAKIVYDQSPEVSDFLKEVSLFDISKIFKDAIDNAPTQDSFKIYKEIVSLTDQKKFIMESFEGNEVVSLKRIVKKLETKIEIIVTFLALLEMIKQSEILCTQKKIFQDIEIKLTIAKA
ncbi:MAG: segregation/condensation protein A [Candidatus Marinimicrobia bacterium]|nr:segregation/condensation protein A [Candidatus Neomarinimicrobiota bacterium]